VLGRELSKRVRAVVGQVFIRWRNCMRGNPFGGRKVLKRIPNAHLLLSTAMAFVSYGLALVWVLKRVSLKKKREKEGTPPCIRFFSRLFLL
jgi:hypothetical protein